MLTEYRGWQTEYRHGAGGGPLARGGQHRLSGGRHQGPNLLPATAAAPPPVFALMKLDVEGFECAALRGMRRLLAAGAIQTAKLEVFDDALRAQV